MSEAALQLKSLSRFPCFAPCFKGEMLSYYQEAIFNSWPQKNKVESLISDTEQQNIKSRESLRPLGIFGGAKGSTGEMMLCLTQQNKTEEMWRNKSDSLKFTILQLQSSGWMLFICTRHQVYIHAIN